MYLKRNLFSFYLRRFSTTDYNSLGTFEKALRIMKVLIVTDLDNTLVGDEQALQALNRKLSAARDSIGLVYATGRSYGSTRYLIEDAGLLEPDYFITGVGSEIYKAGSLDLDWKTHLSQDWDRQAICKVASEFSELALQPQPEQNPWKISFLLASGSD